MKMNGNIMIRSFVLMVILMFLPTAVFAGDEHTYTVRGVVKKLPKDSSNEVIISHEPIPDYMDMDGNKVGMKGMTMPFYLADGVSLDGIQAGDRVEFTYMSRWKPTPDDKVTAIRKLVDPH